MLTWLRDQVLALWSRISQVLSSAYSYASDRASSALASAKAWATTAIAAALATAGRWIDAAATSAQQLLAIAKYELLQLIAKAATAAQQLVSIAKYELLQLIAKAATAAQQLVAIAEYNLWQGLVAASAAAQQLVTLAKYELFKALAEASTAARQLVDIGKSDVSAKVDALSDQLQPAWQFFADPLANIAAYVSSFFLDMLCDVLAHGLGTVKYDLPPKRVYLGGGGGVYIGGGPGPPPGAGGLAPPLSSLYVTGYRFGPSHHGLDLGLTDGQAVFAMHAGVVLSAGWSNVGYGYNVVLEGGGWWTRYAHAKALGVQAGDKVRASQQIANGDSTGNSTGPHLHLEIKYNGQWVDPATVLGT